MNIESLEINLLKASEINEGDVVLVRINEEEKSKFNESDIRDLYQKITKMLKKEIPIYFFPKNIDFEMIKKIVLQHQDSNKENKNL